MANEILCILFLSSFINFSSSLCKTESKYQFTAEYSNYRINEVLICSNLHLNSTTTSTIFSRNESLYELIIDDSYIPKIYDNTFDNSPYFRKVFISKNLVHTIEPNAFAKFKYLFFLDLSYNELNSIDFIIPFTLKTLYISHNNISVLDEIKNCEYLRELDISYNSISNEINLKPFLNLKFLNLSHNYILSLESIPILKVLDVSYNNISSIDFRRNLDNKINNFSAAITLDLNHNTITDIYEYSFKNMTNLQLLNLSYNSIETIHSGAFDDLIHLEQLDLSFNQLHIIPTGLFYHQVSLRALFMTTNFIRNFDYGTFTGLNNLKLFDINDNELRKIDSLYALKNVEELRFRYNFVYRIDVDQLIRHFKSLRKLQFNFPGHSCVQMYLRILKLKTAHITVEDGDVFYHNNINGLYCYSEHFFRDKQSDEIRMVEVGNYFSSISIALIVIIIILIFVVILNSFTLYRVYMKHRKQVEIDSNLHTCTLKLLNENDPLN